MNTMQERFTVVTDKLLVDQIQTERQRLAEQTGLKPSLSATAAALIRRALADGRQSVQQ